MDWTNADDAALYGDGAENALAVAQALRDAGIWPEAHAMRIATSDDKAAWLWVTKAGTLSTMCVAPSGSFDGRAFVPLAEFFAAPWPKDWKTKRKAAPAAQDACVAGGYVCGTMGRDALLCIAAEIGPDGLPSRVIVRMGAPEIATSELGARKWFGMTKWPVGVAELWRRQWTTGDYRNMCRWAGVFEKTAKRRADKAAKRGQDRKT